MHIEKRTCYYKDNKAQLYYVFYSHKRKNKLHWLPLAIGIPHGRGPADFTCTSTAHTHLTPPHEPTRIGSIFTTSISISMSLSPENLRVFDLLLILSSHLAQSNPAHARMERPGLATRIRIRILKLTVTKLLVCTTNSRAVGNGFPGPSANTKVVRRPVAVAVAVANRCSAWHSGVAVGWGEGCSGRYIFHLRCPWEA